MDTALTVAAMIAQVAQPVTLVRYTDSYDPATRVNTRAEKLYPNIPMHVRGYRPQEIIGSVQQGDRQVRVSPASFPTGIAPARLDELRLATGETLRIEDIDPGAGLGGAEALYTMHCRGA